MDFCGVPIDGVAFGASGLGLPGGTLIGQPTSHGPSSLPGQTVSSAANHPSKASIGPDSYVLAFKILGFKITILKKIKLSYLQFL